MNDRQKYQLNPIPDAEFNDALRRLGEQTRRLINGSPYTDFAPKLRLLEYKVEDDGRLTPFESFVLPVGMDIEKRNEYLFGLGVQKGHDMAIIRACFFLSEAWLSIQSAVADAGRKTGSLAPASGAAADGSTGSEPRKYALPAEDPERQEIITIMGRTIDGRCNVARLSLRRTDHGYLRAGALMTFPHGGDGEVSDRLLVNFYAGYQQGVNQLLASHLGRDGQ